LKKPTGSVRFRFFKSGTGKTKPNQTGTEKNRKKKPSQTEKTEQNRKTEPNRKNQAKPV